MRTNVTLLLTLASLAALTAMPVAAADPTDAALPELERTYLRVCHPGVFYNSWAILPPGCVIIRE